MASSAKKTKSSYKTSSDESQLSLIYAEDSLTKYWNSKENGLFNTVYLRHDISEKYENWKNDDDLDFQNFLNTIRNFAAEYKDREKELLKWSETETISNLIIPILSSLGWKNNCTNDLQNPYLQETSFRYEGKTYRTDILIVDHPKEKQYINDAEGIEKLKEARQTVLLPVEAKYWQRIEEFRQDREETETKASDDVDDLAISLNPNEQIVQYMKMLGKNWGILTDGSRWRLFNSELSVEDSDRFYEFNFYALFQSLCTEQTQSDTNEIIEASKYFYHFFSKYSFFPKHDSEKPFVDQVLEYSKKYVNKVEEDLKDRFVKAMNIACNSFYKSAKNNSFSQDLSNIRNVAESTLFNILFIKSLESRGVLPMNSTDYKKISLSSIIDKIERFDPTKEDLLNFRELERSFKKGNGNSFSYSPHGTELHDRILRLTGVIHKGATSKDNFGFEISGFRESIFSDIEWKFFKNCKMENHDWVQILFELGYADSESLSRKYQQIPYAYFTPRQLGSIYESFLEFKLDKATEDMVFENKQWKPVDLNNRKYKLSDIPKVKSGQLFFTPDNLDRKDSGSYYTPDSIVQQIVLDTLSPLVENKTPEEIKNIKVCDPAMGSGHFLGAALKFLTKSFVLASIKKNKKFNSETEAKSEVLHSCIFGVDINPRAVKLAKMSLWLESASNGGALENLDDQLKYGDALVSSFDDYDKNFNWNTEFSNIKFNAIVGNPPWISMLGKHKASSFDKKYVDHLINVYGLDTNRPNVYEAFVRKSLQLIKTQPGSRYGVITPDRLGLNEQFMNLRAYILDNFSLEKVTYGTPFPGVIVDTGIFMISSGTNSTSYVGTTYPDITATIEISQVKSDKYLSFSVNSVKATPKILRSGATELVNGGICSSFVGFIAGKGKLSDTQLQGYSKVLKGRDIQPFKVLGYHFIN
jgi:hypothetical protein